MTTSSRAAAIAPRHRASWLPAYLLCLALAACGGDDGPANADPLAPTVPDTDQPHEQPPGDVGEDGTDAAALVPGPVFGKVSLDGPVAGAIVSLQAADGSAWAGSAVTDDEGMFEIPVAQVPRGLRIVASGGTRPDGTPVSGTLSSYVEPFSATFFGEQVTAVTTLLDRLHAAGPLDLATAQTTLAHYLQLQPGRSLYSGFAATNDFNSAVFLLEADASGLGLDAFVDAQVARALASAENQQVFTGGLQISPLGTTIAMGLISGAVGKLSGTATGEILSGLGIGQADHAAVMAQLRLIETKLDEVKGGVDEANKRLADLQVQTIQTSLQPLMSHINTFRRELQGLGRYSGSDEHRLRLQMSLEDRIINALQDSSTAFADVLEGRLGPASLVQAYADSLRVGQRFYSKAHYQRLVDAVELYDSYNLQLHYLLIEAYRSRGARDKNFDAQWLIDTLFERMKEDRDQYLRRMPWALPDDTTFIHIDTLRMWHSSRSYYVLWDEAPALPYDVRIKGGWRKPDVATVEQAFRQTTRNRIDGNQFAVQQGAPAGLFAGGGINMWTTECSLAHMLPGLGSCQVYHFADDNPMRVSVSDNALLSPGISPLTNRAHYAVWRPMEQAEAAMYLPWLYSQRPH